MIEIIFLDVDGCLTDGKIVYSTATKVAATETPFTMTRDEDKVVGKALVYDFELKKAYIKKAFALIEQDRKKRDEK